MKKYLSLHWLSVAFILAVWILPAAAQTGEYKVWVKTSPCSGRYDWISVGKDDPSYGMNYYVLANAVFPGTGCTTLGCSFDAANAIANSLRSSPALSRYCCRDYSVWENAGTRERRVVVGKMSNAGPGWVIIQSGLCCEEAESLAGKPGACSGSPDIEQLVRNTQCWPGSYAAWNDRAKKVECYCPTGKVWNSSKTACVEEAVKDVNCWPGSYAATNPQTGKVECYCNPGLVWNATKTACVEPAVQITCWPGSYAAKNPLTGKVECYCNPGLVWNATQTACVEPNLQTQCWPGSHAAVNPQTGKIECYCNTGLVWNSTKTACVDPNAQTPCWPGSHAAVNPQTGKTECYCDAGLVWNSTKTACVEPDPRTIPCWPGSHAAKNPQTGKTECFCDAGLVWNSTKNACVTPGAGGGATWKLVSATVSPRTPAQSWSFSGPMSASAQRELNGDKMTYQWTPPPEQFDASGFTMTLNARGQPAGKGNISVNISSTGYGLTSSIPEKETGVLASAENGNTASGAKSWTYTPFGSSSEIEILITLNWGSVRYSYKYQKVQ